MASLSMAPPLVSDNSKRLIRHKRHGAAAVLCAFDLIELNGEDLRRSSIEYRKRKLAKLVRGRIKGDVERLMSCKGVFEDTTGQHDYRYRAFLDRDRVADKIAEHVCAIRYAAFKPAVTDKRRGGAYFDVWSRMDDLQWELSGDVGDSRGHPGRRKHVI
jgi:hypothetical protein